MDPNFSIYFLWSIDKILPSGVLTPRLPQESGKGDDADAGITGVTTIIGVEVGEASCVTGFEGLKDGTGLSTITDGIDGEDDTERSSLIFETFSAAKISTGTADETGFVFFGWVSLEIEKSLNSGT